MAAHVSSEREPAGRKREKDGRLTAGRRGDETTQSRPWPSSRALPSAAERRDAVSVQLGRAERARTSECVSDVVERRTTSIIPSDTYKCKGAVRRQLDGAMRSRTPSRSSARSAPGERARVGSSWRLKAVDRRVLRRDQLEHTSASTSIERLSAPAKYRRDASCRRPEAEGAACSRRGYEELAMLRSVKSERGARDYDQQCKLSWGYLA